MLKIAICDSSENGLRLAEAMVMEYAKNNPEYEISLRCYESGIELLHDVERGEAFKVYIMETDLPRIGGIEIARSLRKMGISASLIFLSKDRGPAVEAFEVAASHYLLKPFEEERMQVALNRVCNLSGRERRRQLPLRTSDGVRYVYVRDIMYSIGQQKIQQIALADGESLSVRITGSKLTEQLTSFGNFFVRCGSSYIVNMFYVSVMKTDVIEMSDGMIIPIPRRARTEIHEAFRAFEEQFRAR